MLLCAPITVKTTVTSRPVRYWFLAGHEVRNTIARYPDVRRGRDSSAMASGGKRQVASWEKNGQTPAVGGPRARRPRRSSAWYSEFRLFRWFFFAFPAEFSSQAIKTHRDTLAVLKVMKWSTSAGPRWLPVPTRSIVLDSGTEASILPVRVPLAVQPTTS